MLGHLAMQLEDDDEPVTAVENFQARLAIAVEGADHDVKNPAAAVASAGAIHLAAHPEDVDGTDNADDTVLRAARAQWPGDGPRSVDDRLAGR
jgi:hypothetical protein